jgi:hypothetical protein
MTRPAHSALECMYLCIEERRRESRGADILLCPRASTELNIVHNGSEVRPGLVD